MAIKCSLLGHSFTETDVEEEREEEGSEVVITIKEVEICDRCGQRQVVSENKEVTSIAAADADDETTAEDASAVAEDPADAGAATVADAAPDIDAAEDDAELIGDDEDDEREDDDGRARDEQRDVDAMTDPEPAAGSSAGEEVTAADDDAVILEDEESEDREAGEWPDEDGEESADGAETTGPTTEEWPDEYGYEEESDASAEDTAWPEEEEDDGDEWTPTETFDVDQEIEPAGGATVTVPEGEFACPECGFATPVEESSLRAGDFCPECHRGTLTHRADETRKE